MENKFKKDFIIKSLNAIKKQSETSLKLYKLGVDLMNLDRGTDLLGESISMMFSNDQKTFKIVDDLVSWWLYEDVNKILYDPENPSIIVADVTDIEDLWKYMIEEPQTYFKNV